MNTHWKAYYVYFLTQEISHRLDSQIKCYRQKTQDWSEGQQSARHSNSHANCTNI